MGCKLITGLAAGVLVGAAVGMAVMPNLDRKTQRYVKRAGRKLKYAAEDAYDSLSSMK